MKVPDSGSCAPSGNAAACCGNVCCGASEACCKRSDALPGTEGYYCLDADAGACPPPCEICPG